jgi:hypothetical protein
MLAFGLILIAIANPVILLVKLVLHKEILLAALVIPPTSWNGSVSLASMIVMMENMEIQRPICVCCAIIPA